MNVKMIRVVGSFSLPQATRKTEAKAEEAAVLEPGVPEPVVMEPLDVPFSQDVV